MSKAKILVQGVTPVVNRLNEKIKTIGLRRDIYLNNILRVEVARLDTALEGKENSVEAKDYLVKALRALPTTAVSIMLEKDVIESIDKVCEKHNLARDCFVNRIFFFLAAEEKHLSAVGFQKDAISADLNSLSVNSLDNAGSFLMDPFFEIREFLSTNQVGDGFYSWPFHGKLMGLNCYMEDEYVPGTKQYSSLESLLTDL